MGTMLNNSLWVAGGGAVIILFSILLMMVLPESDSDDPNYISDRGCYLMMACCVGCVLLVVGLIVAGIIWLVGLIW